MAAMRLGASAVAVVAAVAGFRVLGSWLRFAIIACSGTATAVANDTGTAVILGYVSTYVFTLPRAGTVSFCFTRSRRCSGIGSSCVLVGSVAAGYHFFFGALATGGAAPFPVLAPSPFAALFPLPLLSVAISKKLTRLRLTPSRSACASLSLTACSRQMSRSCPGAFGGCRCP